MTKKARRRGSLFALGGLGLVVAVLIVASGVGWGSKEAPAIEGVAVQRGLLRISVVERGNLKAANSVSLKCELEGQTTIQTLPVKNGAEVQAGDVLCILDTSELEMRKVQQGIQVQNARASLTKAEKSYEIQASQNESDIEKALRLLDFARLDLRKYEEGDKPQLLQKADEDILLRDEELQRAKQDLAWSEKLAERGFLEQTQLDADRLAKSRADVALNQARRAKELLEDYEIPRTVQELEAEVKETGAEYDRVQLRAAARIADFESDLETSRAKFQLEQEEYDKIVEQIEKATLRAPVRGTVVFTMAEQSRWGGGSPIQEGAQVREGQEIMTIPSSDDFLAEASLHESVIEKVREGMPCVVTVDALQLRVPGVVRYKARQNDQNAWFANPDLRLYKTEIELTGADERMRPGMSCNVEILVRDIEDALFVPVQSVFPDGPGHVAFLSQGNQSVKRAVQVGENNGKWVEIVAGLSENELVLLAQPPGTTLAPPPEHRDERPEGAGPPGEGGGGPGGPGGRGPSPTAAHVDEDSSGSAGEASAVAGDEDAADADGGQGDGRGDRRDAAERWKKALEAETDPAKREEMQKRMQAMRETSERGGPSGSDASGAPSGSQ
jgi:HlyD family secretion protein